MGSSILMGFFFEGRELSGAGVSAAKVIELGARAMAAVMA